jgi:hypothetical protein
MNQLEISRPMLLAEIVAEDITEMSFDELLAEKSCV